MTSERLGESFFARSVHAVARDLIGCELSVDGAGGIIVEAESYAADDPACHGYRGETPRNRSLFGPPGRAYVYVSYGIHRMLNFVAEAEGVAGAVLIRAIEPRTGIDLMTARRGGRPLGELCAGPGRLAGALAIDLGLDGAPLDREPFTIRAPEPGDGLEVVTGPRVGITRAVDLPWRFSLAGSPFVSRPRPGARVVATRSGA